MNPKSKRFKNVKFETVGDPLSPAAVQDVLLEMMKSLHDFCELHNIRYTLACGSLLGAVRHKGFIPWDDDMDVYMPRPDYERFIKYSNISDRYQIVTPENDHGYYHPFAYAVIADTKTIMVEKAMRCPTGKGQFLDIFPLDAIPDNQEDRNKQFRKMTWYGKVKGVQSDNLWPPKIKRFKDFVKWVCTIVFTPLDEMKIVAKQDALARKYDYDAYEYSTQMIVSKDRYRLTYRHDYFDDRLLVPFDKYEFYITKDWDEVLKMEYGDYMQLPPVEERVGVHSIDLYYRK